MEEVPPLFDENSDDREIADVILLISVLHSLRVPRLSQSSSCPLQQPPRQTPLSKRRRQQSAATYPLPDQEDVDGGCRGSQSPETDGKEILDSSVADEDPASDVSEPSDSEDEDYLLPLTSSSGTALLQASVDPEHRIRQMNAYFFSEEQSNSPSPVVVRTTNGKRKQSAWFGKEEPASCQTTSSTGSSSGDQAKRFFFDYLPHRRPRVLGACTRHR